MGGKDDIKKTYALLGKSLQHSFSQSFFTQKFIDLELETYLYKNYEFKDEQALADFLLEEVYTLSGFNVTVPYKETIIPFLDKISEEANDIGAVNTVKISKGKLIGYNTDIYGFTKSIQPLLEGRNRALVLGTGGASKAIVYALEQLQIQNTLVSRKPKNNRIIAYQDITEEVFQNHDIIINCTPLGTFPNINTSPKIPFELIRSEHLVYDLVYNPEKTLFLEQAESKGASIKNGLEMLFLQAEKAWMIWNS